MEAGRRLETPGIIRSMGVSPPLTKVHRGGSEGPRREVHVLLYVGVTAVQPVPREPAAS